MAKVIEITLAELGNRKRPQADALAIRFSTGRHLKLVGPTSTKLEDTYKARSPWIDTDIPRTTYGRDTLWLFRRHIIRYEMLTWACDPYLRAYSYRTLVAACLAFSTFEQAATEYEHMLMLART
jgi:hypothetical protein